MPLPSPAEIADIRLQSGATPPDRAINFVLDWLTDATDLIPSGLTIDEIQPMLSAGGSHPITELADLTAPLTLNVGPLSITDGSLERVFLASGTGLSLYDGAGVPTVVAGDGGIVLKQGQSFVVQDYLSVVVRASLAPGQLILADPDGNTIVDIEPAFGGMLLKDASGIERVKLFNDGSGLTLSDADANDRVVINETIGIDLLDAGGHARAAMAEGSLGLNGDGVGNVYWDFASVGVMQMRDADNTLRVEQYNTGDFNLYDADGTLRSVLLPDGSGLTLYDASGANPAVLSYDNLVLLLALI